MYSGEMEEAEMLTVAGVQREGGSGVGAGRYIYMCIYIFN